MNKNEKEYYIIDIETIDIKCRIYDKEFDSYLLNM